MNSQRWTNGILREDVLNMKKGDRVVFLKSTVKHTSIGPTWWIMSATEKKIAHAAESAYGPRVNKLVEAGEEVRLAKQLDCEHRAKGLLASSVYAPHNVKRLTYFQTDRSTLPKKEFHVDIV